MTKPENRKKNKNPRSKPVSLYGIPFEDAVEGLLKTKPPPKKKKTQKSKK